MEDLKAEVAGLVADVAAVLHALSDTAAQSVFDGPMEGLPASLLAGLPALSPSPAWVPPPRPPSVPRALTPAPPPPVAAPPVAPPRPPSVLRPLAPAPPPTVAAAPVAPLAVPRSLAPTPIAAPLAPPPAPAGLFGGKWAAVLKDPADDLRALWNELPTGCDACGAPPPRGAGSVRARLAVVATPMSGESDAMLQRMLVHVLAMERGDAFVIAPGGCAACAELARRQVVLVAPRVVLVMGEVAARVTRVPYGKWGRWTDLDALATHHPDAIVAKPELKAPVFEHLKDVARRV